MPKLNATRNRQQERRDRRQDRILARQAAERDFSMPVRPRKRTVTHVAPMTEAQEVYDENIRDESIVFGIGPAGTGKTWFAAMRAAQALEAGEIDKIIVTRPNVEAAEDKLGFLPGELDEKYEPYFRPVKDAFVEFFGESQVEGMIKSGAIEARPLAFLRGATLKNCWVIADEMQNATRNQMKLLLSRIGENAKFIVNGDPNQLDIPKESTGLVDAMERLDGIKGVAAVMFGYEDIVRSGLCQAIVQAYENPSDDRYIYSENDNAGVRRFLKAS
ncbi:PhoH family protein [Aureimonas sp. AU40]|uniref:PhoH family protein n=1 Tax=Aureimonas sp. AU40 TaxID=1637747 RepID=UPI000782907B|nr:PhoH family protein [Aureimonas sp. AU40]